VSARYVGIIEWPGDYDHDVTVFVAPTLDRLRAQAYDHLAQNTDGSYWLPSGSAESPADVLAWLEWFAEEEGYWYTEHTIPAGGDGELTHDEEGLL
jgi:hypothetical protein